MQRLDAKGQLFGSFAEFKVQWTGKHVLQPQYILTAKPQHGREIAKCFLHKKMEETLSGVGFILIDGHLGTAMI